MHFVYILENVILIAINSYKNQWFISNHDKCMVYIARIMVIVTLPNEHILLFLTFSINPLIKTENPMIRDYCRLEGQDFKYKWKIWYS